MVGQEFCVGSSLPPQRRCREHRLEGDGLRYHDEVSKCTDSELRESNCRIVQRIVHPLAEVVGEQIQDCAKGKVLCTTRAVPARTVPWQGRPAAQLSICQRLHPVGYINVVEVRPIDWLIKLVDTVGSPVKSPMDDLRTRSAVVVLEVIHW